MRVRRPRFGISWRSVLVAALAAVPFLVFAIPVLGRPGGGEGYGGGGGGGGFGGGGGGGDGAGDLIFLLFRLTIAYPEVMIPIDVVILVGYLWSRRTSWESKDVDLAPGPPPLPPAARVAMGSMGPTKARSFDVLREEDPEFSRVVFDDFAYRLYATAHLARHDARKLSALAPYLSEHVRELLVERAPAGTPVTFVAVGSLTLHAVHTDPGAKEHRIVLSIESNLGLGADQRVFCRERWTLVRPFGVLSKPPGASAQLQCPSCGGAFDAVDSAKCAYCGEIVTDGRFDWQVTNVLLLSQRPLLTSLGEHAAERGTHLPTKVDPGLERSWATLVSEDPALGDRALEARLLLVFRELNAGWSAQDLAQARPFVSDGLFDYLRYWIDAYKAHGLRNVTDRARIIRWCRVKLVRDRYYDALTVRIWADGLDYTERTEDGALIGGSKTLGRRYSEYWTLIRGRDVRGTPSAEQKCAGCGAALSVNMAGQCAYCQAHVTSGEFDWVLSRIEQDEAYRG